MTASRDSGSRITFDVLFPSMKQVYGTEAKDPTRADLLLYKKYDVYNYVGYIYY